MILLTNNDNRCVGKIVSNKELELKFIKNKKNAYFFEDINLSEDIDLYEIIDGKPQLIDGWEKIKEERIKQKQKELFKITQKETLKRLQNQTKSYIEKYYPEIKQRSDVNDKEFWGSWLIYHFPDVHNSDSLYKKLFEASAKILEKQSNFQTELNNLQEITEFENEEIEFKYKIALEQLLKVALRQGWVQECKTEFSIKKSLVKKATTIEELENIKLNFKEYPL